MTLYSILSEGYSDSFPEEEKDRVIRLKNGSFISAMEINAALQDEDAASAIRFYQRFKRMGMPYGSWALNPARLVEVVDILEPLDRFYHPQVTI